MVIDIVKLNVIVKGLRVDSMIVMEIRQKSYICEM